MPTDYVSSTKAPLYKGKTGSGRILDLLWGDRVRTLQTGGGRTHVKARGRSGWVKNSDLGGDSLLEVYFIDVGQGDAVLVRTPDHRHILIDGGYVRRRLSTNKNAADFVDWKFKRDYGKSKIELDAMIASHCDADHYGGLWDLLAPEQRHELRVSDVEVGAFYHAGVSWWKGTDRKRDLGKITSDHGRKFLTQLVDDRANLGKALRGIGGERLQGEWAQFMGEVHSLGCKVERLSHVNEYLPGFEPANGKASIRVLGPVEYDVGGKSGLPSFGSNSQNSNGHSVLLRLDFGSARILLTGDLNKKAQQQLLEDWEGQRTEFLCDVAKGCHHGSVDVSFEFLRAMRPAATVISSGDNESHAHPRPKVVAASGITGHLTTKNDEIITPLVYSTEISRSVRIGTPSRFALTDFRGDDGLPISETDLQKVRANYTVVKAGALNGEEKESNLKYKKLVDGVVYGLVNVRTDGKRILCATMNEAKSKWDIEEFESRF